MVGPDVEIRAAGPDDRPAVVALVGAALGWRSGDPNAELFAWKHDANPFGPSPMWVAEADGRLVGVRVFLRWELVDRDGGVVHAVRAVDTATHPDARGRGVFTRLTTHALEALGGDVDFVFNTPNAESRPGYLKMGWEVVGRVPVGVSVTGVGAAGRAARSRVPAEKWSLDRGVGDDAGEVLDRDGFRELLRSQPAAEGIETRRSVELLRWRYAGGPITYRALLRRTDVADGVALFRLRRRGRSVEATLCDVLVPGGDPRLERELVRAVLRTARPDYLIRVQRALVDGRCVRLPGQGPILTWRALRSTTRPSLATWNLTMGDVEVL